MKSYFGKINWKTSVMLIMMLTIQKFVHAQMILSDKTVDTDPIELYLEVANTIKKNGKPDADIVKKYFNNPTVALFKQRPGFDSLKFMHDLTAVYTNEIKDSPKSDRSSDYYLMLKYKENEAIIRKSITHVKNANISNLVKKRLKPFYPASFNMDAVSLQYIYLFTDEGNGGFPGYVFNSALQTAYLTNKDIDVISAHEAYHSITNTIFMNTFRRLFEGASGDTAAQYQHLLWYLEIVAEEGIADLIDKPVLTAQVSPLSAEIKKLRMNEKPRSELRIRQLDSLLSNSGEKANFAELNNLLENGGHIPGRYMALKIKEGNLLEEYIKHTGNPIKFIYLYNEAVKNDAAAAKFSPGSILYLKNLENKFIP